MHIGNTRTAVFNWLLAKNSAANLCSVSTILTLPVPKGI
ncbi:MAG: hypothetical protein ACLU99_05500 [Alphaproteobacteria bacterium]